MVERGAVERETQMGADACETHLGGAVERKESRAAKMAGATAGSTHALAEVPAVGGAPTSPGEVGGITVVLAGSPAGVRRAADRVMGELTARGTRVARLLPNTRRAMQRARQLANADTPLLGTPVTTLDEWALDRWALFGDGRTPVYAAERRALTLQAIAQTPTPHLPADARGIVGCVESMVRTATGTLAFDQDASPADEAPTREATCNAAHGSSCRALSDAQRELLAICHTYTRLLTDHGLIERAAAIVALPDAMGAAGWSHLLFEDVSELDAVQEGLVVQAAAHEGATLVIRWRERMPEAASETEALVAQVNALAAPPTPEDPTAPDAAALDELLDRLHPAYAKLRDLLTRLAARPGVTLHFRRFADEPAIPASAPTPDELTALRDALFQPSPERVVVPTGAVRFVLPAGRYARSEALAREIIRLRDTGIAPRSIVLACKDPLAMADSLAGRLACADIACVAAGITPLALTNAGRALLGLVQLVEAESLAAQRPHESHAGAHARGASEVPTHTSAPAPAPELVPVASDLALNPLLHVSGKDARALDATWRANRLASATDLLAGLTRASAVIRRAVEVLRADDVAAAVSTIVRRNRSWATDADRLRDEPGLGSLAHRVSVATELTGPLPVSSAAIERLVAGASVRISRLTVPPNSLDAMREAAVLKSDPNAVRIMGLGDVAGVEARAVIVCDLTADAYPLSDRSDAASALLGKLGLPAPVRATDELRWQFMGAIEAAGEALVFERPLSDERAEPLRPAALLEEVVDCYRPDITAQDDLDKRTGLPTAWSEPPAAPPAEPAQGAPAGAPLEADSLASTNAAQTPSPAGATPAEDPGRARAFVGKAHEPAACSTRKGSWNAAHGCPWHVLGEEEFGELVSPVGPLDRATFAVDAPQLLLREEASAHLLVRDDLVMSPSSLELYLSCPARWFFERRLPADTLDAAFDPPARGRLYHAVLRLFHERLHDVVGIARIAPDTPDDALAAADELLDACLAEVRAQALDPKSGLPVAATPLEERSFEGIGRKLHDCIRRDRLIPRAYVPLHHEWEFGYPERPGQKRVPYAGIALHGIIDRIDVDDAGHALVIDYKGNLTSGYELPEPAEAVRKPATADEASAAAPTPCATSEAASADSTDPRASAPTGTASAAPEPPAEEPTIPLHSQALMYATALMRGGASVPAGATAGAGATTAGSAVAPAHASPAGAPSPAASQRPTPTGTLYLSYAQDRIKGFADPCAFAPDELPPDKGAPLTSQVLVHPTRTGTSGLRSLLRRTEAVATQAVERLREGDIEPNPRFGALSCERCPLTTCPKRVM